MGIARGPHVLPVAMFLGSSSWSFVYVSLPFYIQRISTLDPAATLRWTGWILGVSSLGTVGAVSTFAFVSAGRSADVAAVRREVAAIQSGMTIGPVIGPLAGAIVAARLGFRASFVVGGLILIACSGLVHWGIEEPGPPAAAHGTRRAARFRDVLAVALIVLGGSTQIFFLAARIAAAFLGPVIATSLLAWTPGPLLYVVLALMGIACLPLVTSR